MKDVYKCVVCGSYTESPIHCGRRCVLLMRGRDRVRLSKLISFILRHSPESIRIKLSPEGWVRINDLVRGIKEFWVNKELYSWVTEEHVKALATLDPKGRFELRGDFIRARYGHSRGVKVSLRYEEDISSKYLYHGTTIENLKNIMKEGIKPMKRWYVHLTTDPNVACETGERHGGKAAYLVINVDCLRSQGHKVLKASEIIRLTDYVPPVCIEKYLLCNKAIS